MINLNKYPITHEQAMQFLEDTRDQILLDNTKDMIFGDLRPAIINYIMDQLYFYEDMKNS